MYYNVVTKEFPRYEEDLLALGWEKGTPLPENWVEVFAQPLPENIKKDHRVVPSQPKLVDNIWVLEWKTKKLSKEELEASKPKNFDRIVKPDV